MPAATVTVPSNVFLLDGETVGLSEGEGVVGTGVNGASVGVSVGCLRIEMKISSTVHEHVDYNHIIMNLTFEVIGDSDGKGVT